MNWRWRTDDERDKAISDETIELTSPYVGYVHPENFMQCVFETSKPEIEELLAECPHYEREDDCSPDDRTYCACINYWGMGFKGLCEKAIAFIPIMKNK